MDDEVTKAKAQKKSNALFVLACARGYLDDVKALLDKGADSESVDKQKVSGLHFACGQGRLEVVKFLWSRGVELDSEDPGGNLPLHYAVAGSKTATVNFLLSKGAWVEGSNSLDDTVLHVAARKGQQDLLQLLLEHGGKAILKDVNKRGLTALGEALAAGHVALADTLLKAGADLQQRPRGWSLLHITASLGKAGSTKFLLGRGLQVQDAGNAEGMTPLHCAAATGNLEAAKLLVHAGADLALATLKGEQAYQLVAPGHKDLTNLLRTTAPPKTPLVSVKTAAAGPRNDLDSFKALDDAGRKAKVDRWAATEDAKQLDRALLEFPLELKTQILEMQRLMQILNIQQAIVELLDDGEFQKLAQNPRASEIVEEVHSNPEAFRRYSDDKTVMMLLRTLQRFQAVVRANGGHQIPFQSLLKSCEPTYQEKSLMQLKGMKLMLHARRRAAIAAALAGSEAEAKAAAAQEMDPDRQRKPGIGREAAGSSGSAPVKSVSSASVGPQYDPVSTRKRAQAMGKTESQPEILSTVNGGPQGGTGQTERQPFSWKLLGREMVRALKNSLMIFSFFVLIVWVTTGSFPWQQIPSVQQESYAEGEQKI